MRINGHQVAQLILSRLKSDCQSLKSRGITPTLSVIMVGKDPTTLSYIKQKEKAGKKIGAQVNLYQLPQNITEDKIIKTIKKLNQNPSIHGIIVQLPLPPKLKTSTIIQAIDLQKDVDGFLANSPFTPPIAQAVINILKYIYKEMDKNVSHKQFNKWLKSKNITVIGRGLTGGKPIIKTLKKKDLQINTIHRGTKNAKEILKKSDIIISAVGKKRLVKSSDIKQGVVLIGIGIHREKNKSKLVGDYDEKEISQKAAFYTPTPGGVGPVNVACLWQNVIKAAKKQLHNSL